MYILSAPCPSAVSIRNLKLNTKIKLIFPAGFIGGPFSDGLFTLFPPFYLLCSESGGDLRPLGAALIWLPSYLLYNHALKITSGKLRTQRWSNIVDTVIFPYMILPILLETLFIKEKKFHVTNKGAYRWKEI